MGPGAAVPSAPAVAPLMVVTQEFLTVYFSLFSLYFALLKLHSVILCKNPQNAKIQSLVLTKLESESSTEFSFSSFCVCCCVSVPAGFSGSPPAGSSVDLLLTSRPPAGLQ